MASESVNLQYPRIFRLLNIWTVIFWWTEGAYSPEDRKFQFVSSKSVYQRRTNIRSQAN